MPDIFGLVYFVN